jgi:hypothetical protein
MIRPLQMLGRKGDTNAASECGARTARLGDVCAGPAHYANEIEPSLTGSAAIWAALTHREGAHESPGREEPIRCPIDQRHPTPPHVARHRAYAADVFYSVRRLRSVQSATCAHGHIMSVVGFQLLE